MGMLVQYSIQDIIWCCWITTWEWTLQHTEQTIEWWRDSEKSGIHHSAL